MQTLADMTIQEKPISEIQQFIESTAPGDGTVGDADGHDEHEVEDAVL